ncbi:chromate transporter [Acidaminobacter hydrogenoformans]|uniref:Chromate transporter n=1 Tax=Acidaminobacter hydrogenoformans DSM 2784 TaxID=1120920 RepID=A0A1G5S3I3_9FIRM|nr:chromate transporter [Acidaminobacter hydrogenoformans]SCZ80718.1 chromate transporter [Acidaminobacter hydrogenoformans DSM 2784]
MYRALLTTFFKIGLFTFGGGYAMIPLIEEEIVWKKEWMTDEEILDIISVAQSLPGPIAVNLAAFIGYRLKKLRGALMAALGVILPSFLIIVIIAHLLIKANIAKYIEPVFSGLMPAVAVMILISAYRLGKKVSWSPLNIGIFALAAILLIALGVHPILVIAGGIVTGLLLNKVFPPSDSGLNSVKSSGEGEVSE